MTPKLYKELSKERLFKIEIHENKNYLGLVKINDRTRFGLKQARSMMSHYSILDNGLNYKLIEI